MPPSRTVKYSIWRSCERFKLDPRNWDELDIAFQADLIAYDQIRQVEEQELVYGPAKAMAGVR
jgi:hypothetical protein